MDLIPLKTPKGSYIPLGHTTVTWVDSTDYYFGCNIVKAPSTTSGNDPIRFQKAGNIRGAHISTFATTETGTNENISAYVRLNNTTDTLIQTVGSATALREFISRSLNIPVTTADYVEIKITCPAFATNPTGVRTGGWLFIEWM